MVTLAPGHVSLRTLEHLQTSNSLARLADDCYEAMRRSADRVSEIAIGGTPVYGVNTGFGKLASVRIGVTDLAALQENLIRSHCCGVGDPLPENVVRLILVLKLISLGRGASGVRPDLARLLEEMLARDVVPVIPAQGSVGASGDLAPLAHLTAVMIGEGEAFHAGSRMPGSEALRRAGLSPVVLKAKEGLALINGTQVSTALALVGLFRAIAALKSGIVASALSIDAAMGSCTPFRSEIHALRGHRGQIEVAASLRGLLEGSAIRESHRENDDRVQDPYSLRCQPQVTGACLDLLRVASSTLEIEANGVTDNPLVLDDGSVVSGGNFHAEPVAFAADQIALAVAEMGAISQRRIAMLVDPTMSYGLPAFLTKQPGLNSGFMIAEVTSAALMSESKHLANPASVDSTPTAANQEDHVSMACHGARRLMPMTQNLFVIIGIEALVAAQGIELRAPLSTSPALQRAIEVIRSAAPSLEDDRPLASDIEAAARLISCCDIVAAIRDVDLPGLERHSISGNAALAAGIVA